MQGRLAPLIDGISDFDRHPMDTVYRLGRVNGLCGAHGIEGRFLDADDLWQFGKTCQDIGRIVRPPGDRKLKGRACS